MRGLSSVMRAAHVSSLCGESQGDSVPVGTVRQLSDRPCHPLGLLTSNYIVTQRQQVVAALSAAVTTTKPIGARTHLAGGTK